MEQYPTVRIVALTPATVWGISKMLYYMLQKCYTNVIQNFEKVGGAFGGVGDRSTETKSRLLIAWGCEWGQGGLQRARRELSEVMEMSDIWI